MNIFLLLATLLIALRGLKTLNVRITDKFRSSAAIKYSKVLCYLDKLKQKYKKYKLNIKFTQLK